MSYKHNKKWRLRHTKKRNAQRAKYYHKHSKASARLERWSERECNLIMARWHSDVMLHLLLARSVQAIQSKRCELLKRR